MTEGAREDSRYATDWPARARIEHESRWRPCRVVDIARAGALIELGWTPDADVLQRTLHLRVRPAESTDDALAVRGDITQQSVSVHGQMHVWVRFAGRPLRHEQLLELLLRMRP